jgi:hypothetical protein
MSVDSYNATDTLNTSLEGIPVGEGAMTIPSINDLFRKMAASIRVFRNNAYCKDKNVTIQASGGGAPASPAENDLWIEYTP